MSDGSVESAPANESSSQAPESESGTPSIEKVMAKAEAKRLLKVKVDGQELEVDEDEVIRDYGKGRAADKKFQEAASMRKEAVSFIEALKKDPISVLNNPKLGLNLREIAETHLLSILEDEMMDPKDRELKTLKREKQTWEEREKQEAEAKKEKELAELTQNYREEYEKSFQTCLESSGLPKTPYTVKRLAYYMNEGMKRGMDLKPDDVVSIVKEEYLEEQKSLFGSLDGESLLKLLGEDLAKKIRKYDTSRVAKPSLVGKDSQPKQNMEVRGKQVERVSKDDWKSRMDRIKAGLE